jgi:hypothetical protein
VRLSGTVIYPSGPGPFPGVVFLHGSGAGAPPSSRSSSFPAPTTRFGCHPPIPSGSSGRGAHRAIRTACSIGSRRCCGGERRESATAVKGMRGVSSTRRACRRRTA